MKKFAAMMLSLAAGSMLLTMTGCSQDRLTIDDVRGDISPELESVASTQDQRKNDVARYMDSNLRQIHDDWDSIWLLNRPLRMSSYPIPNR